MAPDRLYSPLAPLAVATFVILNVAIRQLIFGEIAGISSNIFAIISLIIGGLLGAANV